MSTLNSKHLILKVLALPHVDALTDVYAGTMDRDQIVKSVFASDTHWRKNGFGTWAVFESEGLQCIGIASLTNISQKPTFFILIKPECRLRGYAREAAQAILDYAFKMHKLPEVFANKGAADSFLKKLGFSELDQELILKSPS